VRKSCYLPIDILQTDSSSIFPSLAHASKESSSRQVELLVSLRKNPRPSASHVEGFPFPLGVVNEGMPVDENVSA
jgi:hypothetical protein